MSGIARPIITEEIRNIYFSESFQAVSARPSYKGKRGKKVKRC